MKVDINNMARPEVETLLYATVYDKMSEDERDLMNRFIFSSTDLFVGTLDGEIACVWGCIPPTLLSSRAYLWLYTTDVVKEHTFLFIRHSQLAMEKLLEKYDTVVGTTIAGNDKAIRWLKWLGATFEPSDGRKLNFEIRKSHG